jgi:hypothetical protein
MTLGFLKNKEKREYKGCGLAREHHGIPAPVWHVTSDY